jgi:hypothetical protein
MSIPGFSADSSLGPVRGIYRGSAVSRGSGDLDALAPAATSRVLTALAPFKECTITHSGFVTFPVRVCRSPFPSPDPGEGTFGTDLGGGLQGTTTGLAERSAVARFGDAHLASLSRFCTIVNGPWLADIEQHVPCSIFEPDHFVLSILGTPQPITFEWDGTLEDAPDEVGALGNLSTSEPDCSCCGGLKLCPDGSCKPMSVPCETGVPA